MKILSRIEELILLTVWRLQENAYGVPIRKHIIEVTGTDWSIGAIYVPLDRLVKWGYLEARQGDPTGVRGGRSKRYYKVTTEGHEVLTHIKNVEDSMWLDLPHLVVETKK
jgi:DNA-binding PadR family transcriptional regulator